MRKFGIFLIILGILALLAALGILGYNHWQSQAAMEASDSVLAQMQQSQQSGAAGSDQQGEAESGQTGETSEDVPGDPYADHVDSFDEAAKEMPIRQINGYDYIGYLTIPVLELELPVMSEWDYPRLRRAPCRQFGSTRTDDLVIAAHNYPAHFGHLSQLRSGDMLTFTDMEENVVLYAVISVEIIAPTASEYVKNSDFDLVLYTCTYNGENRVAVFCNRVEL